MNLPNKLTLLRIVIILPFVAFMLVDGIPHRFLWAFAAFVTASLTDMLDGVAELVRKFTGFLGI